MSHLSRYWINAPSEHQRMHRYHGMEVIADPYALEGSGFTRAFPRAGSTISFRCDVRALSTGWPSHRHAEPCPTRPLPVTGINPGIPDPEIPEDLWQDAVGFGTVPPLEAARQGIIQRVADAQLQRCIDWLLEDGTHGSTLAAEGMRAAMRPKPPSLKQQALAQLSALHDTYRFKGLEADTDIICRALESLPD